METKIESPYLSVTVSGAFPRNTLMAVDPATGKYGAAGTGTAAKDIAGHLTQESFADGDERTIRLLNAGMTHTGIASEAIALTDSLQAAASGQIAVSGAGQALGAVPLEAAAAGEAFEYRKIVTG